MWIEPVDERKSRDRCRSRVRLDGRLVASWRERVYPFWSCDQLLQRGSGNNGWRWSDLAGALATREREERSESSLVEKRHRLTFAREEKGRRRRRDRARPGPALVKLVSLRRNTSRYTSKLPVETERIHVFPTPLLSLLFLRCAILAGSRPRCRTTDFVVGKKGKTERKDKRRKSFRRNNVSPRGNVRCRSAENAVFRVRAQYSSTCTRETTLQLVAVRLEFSSRSPRSTKKKKVIPTRDSTFLRWAIMFDNNGD